MLIAIYALMTFAVAQMPVLPSVQYWLEAETGDHHFVVTKLNHDLGLLEVAGQTVLDVGLRDWIKDQGHRILDLRFNDRRRLVVLDSGLSYLIQPDRTPIRLKQHGVDDKALKHFGLADRVTVADQSAAEPDSLKVTIPKDPAVLIITLPTHDREKFDARLLDLTKTSELVLLRNSKTNADYQLALAPGQSVESTRSAIHRAGAFSVNVLDDKLGADAAVMNQESALHALESDVANPRWTLVALLSLAEHADRNPRTLLAARRGLRKFADVLQILRTNLPKDQISRAWEVTASAWTSMQTAGRLILARQDTGLRSLYDRVIDPLTNVYVDALKSFKMLEDPKAERLLLLTAASGGARGLELISRQDWFSWVSERIDLLARVPSPHTFEELRDLGWYQDRPNVQLDQLGVRLRLVDANELNTTDLFTHEIGSLPPWPLLKLGTPGNHRALIGKLLTFLIPEDHRVKSTLLTAQRNSVFEAMQPVDARPEVTAALRRYLRTGNVSADERMVLEPYGILSTAGVATNEFAERYQRIVRESRADGSVVLHNIISALRFPPRPPVPDPKFDLRVYHWNAMELLTDLLETADDTLMTRGTYLSALNTALQLTNLTASSDSTRIVRDPLDRVIKRRLLAHVSKLAKGCSDELIPDTEGVKMWRDENWPD